MDLVEARLDRPICLATCLEKPARRANLLTVSRHEAEETKGLDDTGGSGAASEGLVEEEDGLGVLSETGKGL